MTTTNTLHLVMYPWFAMGHLTPFLQLSNKLASRSHRISFLLPTKVQAKLHPFNFHPKLITFIPLVVPRVEGLPPGAETTSDVPFHLMPHIMTAMDRTRPDIESILRELKPDIVFFDFTHWIPQLAQELGIKSIQYCITSVATVAYALIPAIMKLEQGQKVTEEEFMKQPPGFPTSSSIKLHRCEARQLSLITYVEYGENISFHERLARALKECDASAFRSCREMEGPYVDYLENYFGKPILLSGFVIPDPPTTLLEPKWSKWLNQFKEGSVLFCAFGSECCLEKEQLHELVLGFELTGLPFFVALKAPVGVENIEEALPDGFLERVKERGIVEGGWVQQQLILKHSSIGCFVTHCGMSSITEGIMGDSQLVLLPHAGDQFIVSRMMSEDLKVGVEVKKNEEDGWFTRESVCKAAKLVMDEDSETGTMVRDNRIKLRDLLLKEGLECDYIDGFIRKMQCLIQ